ncbi:MAG: helix-turn-helix transcriptional regulator [Pseudomonadota bacterium]
MQSIALKDALLRLPQVEALTGLSRSSIYRFAQTDRAAKQENPFPSPVRLGLRAVAWRESEVMAWIASRESTAAEPTASLKAPIN